jgi:hypothetical protein
VKEESTVWLRKVSKRNGSRRLKSSQELFPIELWHRYRPYLMDLLVDFLISISQWLCGFVFQRLTKFLAIDGWEGTVILAVHSINIALAFATFGVLFTLDVIVIRKGARSVQ